MFVQSLPEPYCYADCLVREPGWVLPLHSHDYLQAICVETGALELGSESHFFRITHGQLCVIPPGTPHRLSSPQGYSELGFGVSAESVHPLAGLLLSAYKSVTLLDCPELSGSVGRIRAEMEKYTVLSQLKIVHELDSFWIGCLERGGESASSFAERLLRLLNGVPAHRFLLRGAAGELSLSTSQLEKRCRQEFGCGVIALYNRARINRACAMLADSNRSLEDIVEVLRFCDQAHFSKFFKSKTGSTPSQYRKNLF